MRLIRPERVGSPICEAHDRRNVRKQFLKSPPGVRFFFADDSGQTTILVVVCMIVILLFLGFAIDVGHLRLARRDLQSAADAAALAAGIEIRMCGSTTNCSTMQTAAQTALTETGYGSSTLVTNCGTMPSTGLVLMVDDPPCAMGASDPNYGNKAYVEAVVSKQETTYFARLVGWNNVRLTARSEAMRPPTSPCIYALDPTGSGAIAINIGLGISASCSIIDESNSPSAFTCLLGIGISAPAIKVTGGASGFLCTTPRGLQTNVPAPVPADPLAYLPTPAVGSCGSYSGGQWYGSASMVNITLPGTYVFNPGVYCGGISMTAAVLANITFNPGTYILKTGPGLLGVPSGGLNLTVSLLSNIQGNGVTFYNLGSVGGISITAPTTLGLSNFQLTAPTSGMYGGVLFFQDPSNTSTGTFIGNLLSGSKLEGAIYLPNATMTYGVGAISSAYTILVAKDINFNVNILSNFGNDYSSLAQGSPLNGDLAVLAQ